MRAGVRQAVRPLAVPRPATHSVEREGGDERVVLNALPARQGYRLGVRVDSGDGLIGAVRLFLFRQQLGNALPDMSGTALCRKAKHRVGSPSRVLLAMDHVPNRALHIDRGHALAQPRALHLRRRDRPDLEVVGAHENIGDALAHHAHYPLVKVLWLPRRRRTRYLGLHKPIQAVDLILFIEHADVVLKRVSDVAVLNPDVRDALQRVPRLLARPASLVQQLVEVLVVAEDNVAAHVEEKALVGHVSARQTSGLGRHVD
mmetsp:Transcript_15849/g.28134  ORF Transcript_15849/g.28134 Transcript_15849/m.28134 type:complete len:259 (+) Transcript_15849:941-1717(+)